MRRRSGANFEELLNKDWAILTKNEYSELQTAFKRTEQRNGGISFYDLVNIIRSIYRTNRSWHLHHRRSQGQDQQRYQQQRNTYPGLYCRSQHCSRPQKITRVELQRRNP